MDLPKPHPVGSNKTRKHPKPIIEELHEILLA